MQNVQNGRMGSQCRRLCSELSAGNGTWDLRTGVTGLLFRILSPKITEDWELLFQQMLYGFHYSLESLHNSLGLEIE